MPAIGWIFIVLAVGMVLSSLLLLRDTAHAMPISKEKMEKIKERKAELEAEEARKEEQKDP
ncbi:MAG: DUF2897 family protein [Gammaproteobacteria bacterium]|nr:DUF2897 family protein [Gammaproteobacteria bacterium]